MNIDEALFISLANKQASLDKIVLRLDRIIELLQKEGKL